MSNLKLDIGGRKFAVSCAPGEEAHILALGGKIDEAVRQSGAAGQSEPRMLLFAALMLADELHEQRGGTAALAPATDPDGEAELAARIEKLARRIENIARHLEGGDRHA